MTAKQTSRQGNRYVKVSSSMALSGRSTGTGLSIYRYDAFNRLTNYNSGDVEASYTYNANNLRASKTVNRERTDFVWNGQNLAAENKADTVNTYTYDMTGVHIANQNGTVTSYLKDYHGNIVGKTTKAGALFNELGIKMDYDAFGNQWIGDTPDPFGYCGEYLDSESGLIYLRNRYYDSDMGRFINEDPIKDGLNWYVYCGNDPINFWDPFGLLRALREMAENEYGATVIWDNDSRVANVSFSNGINYNFTADGNDDDSAYVASDGVMYVEEDVFEEKLCITSHNYDIFPLDNIPISLNVFEYDRNQYRMEISINNVVRYSDASNKYVRIKSVKTPSMGDIDFMSGEFIDGILFAMSDFYFEANYLSFFREIYTKNIDIHADDIRIELRGGTRYFFARDSHEFLDKSEWAWLYAM